MRKPDSYTVAIYESLGVREHGRVEGGSVGVGGGGGSGEEVGEARRRSVHLNGDWVIVFGEAWK